ncbi:hypothetical protein [Archangium lipolyticum]|uniref:hypothetical protein n=1 Tax=Archangium lipolyticum TaxID=2970465 RepID=UPI00214A5D2C|nr:hypothetical protein [Archangium lipolyticum]
MDWRAIDLHGAASISRVVSIFEIRDMRGIPWTKYKIKVLEEGAGSFLAVANVRVKNANGTPDGEAGLGRTEVEALQDLITRLGERLNSRTDWRDEDFDWTEPQDF